MTEIFIDPMLNLNPLGLKLADTTETALKPIVRAALADGISLNDLELALKMSAEWVLFKERLDMHVANIKRDKAAQTTEGPSGFELADEA